VLLLLAISAHAAQPRNSPSKITLRKRLHVNTLITEPGTIEIDWNNAWSLPTRNFTMPSAIRYTPEGSTIIWGRTEYSAAFDPFGQALTLAGTSVLRDGEKLDIAIAPLATIFLRNESGARLGAVAIARYDSGRNSTGVTVSWSAATASSPSNPAATVDVGFGYGRQLSGSRLLQKFTPHFNTEWEKSTATSRLFLLFEGVEYQITDRLAFDLSGQHSLGAASGSDHQIAFGITYNVGKVSLGAPRKLPDSGATPAFLSR